MATLGAIAVIAWTSFPGVTLCHAGIGAMCRAFVARAAAFLPRMRPTCCCFEQPPSSASVCFTEGGAKKNVVNEQWLLEKRGLFHVAGDDACTFSDESGSR